MFCKTCGNLLKNWDTVCSVCGAPVEIAAAEPAVVATSPAPYAPAPDSAASQTSSAHTFENPAQPYYAPPQEPVQTSMSESAPAAEPAMKFDFSWESDVFHNQDYKGKTEDIEFKWNIGADSVDLTPSPAAAQPAAGVSEAAAAAPEQPDAQGGMFSGDTFHLRTNRRSDANISDAKKNEEFQELLDEEFERIRERQTEIDEERSRIYENVRKPDGAAPSVTVTGETAREAAEARIREYLRKADTEMFRALKEQAATPKDEPAEQPELYEPPEPPEQFEQFEQPEPPEPPELYAPPEQPEPPEQFEQPELSRPYSGDIFDHPSEQDVNTRAFAFNHGEGDVAWEYERSDYDPAISAIGLDEGGDSEPDYLTGKPDAAPEPAAETDAAYESDAADKSLAADEFEELAASVDVPAPGAPAAVASVFDVPASGAPIFDTSFFDAPVPEAPAPGTPAFDTAFFDEPTPNAPAPDAPTPDAPAPDASTPDAPAEPVSDAPASDAPASGDIFVAGFASPFAQPAEPTETQAAPVEPPVTSPAPPTAQVEPPATSPAPPTAQVEPPAAPPTAQAEPPVAQTAALVAAAGPSDSIFDTGFANPFGEPVPEEPKQAEPPAGLFPAVDSNVAGPSFVTVTPTAAVTPAPFPEQDSAKAQQETAASSQAAELDFDSIPTADAAPQESAPPAAPATAPTQTVAPTPVPTQATAATPAPEQPKAITPSQVSAPEPPIKAAPITEAGFTPISQRRHAPDIINKPVVFPFDDAAEQTKKPADEEVFKVTEDKTPEAYKPKLAADDESAPAASGTGETPASSPDGNAKGEQDSAQDKQRKKPNKAVIVIVDILIILAIIAVACWAVLWFAPDSGAATLIREGVVKMSGLVGISGNESNAAGKTDDPNYVMPISDGAMLVSSQLHKNYNIGEVRYDPQASWEDGRQYSVEGAAAAKPIDNDFWKDGPQGQLRYDETAVAAVIQFDSDLVEYINTSGSGKFLSDIATGSSADKKLLGYIASVKQLSVDKLGIGNIRKNGDDLYVWTIETITETKAGSPVQREFKRLYRLALDGDEYKVSDFEDLG
ncbi:MAG: hypothetical protein LBG82_01130 [Clostridiales Family XIII bacterium]|jgi:hypothetical protein|nr:hypothetical protein [Clostridiales Family XIII bacterium]